MRARPVDLPAPGAPIEFLMEVENIVRDFALNFLSSDPVNDRVAEEAAREESISIEGNDPLL